jgi:hypothetical protein
LADIVEETIMATPAAGLVKRYPKPVGILEHA